MKHFADKIGRTSLAAKSFAELRKWIAADPTKVNLAHAGVGSASHLCGLMVQSALKAEMTTVPYKGTGPAMTDLMGGTVDLMCEEATNAGPQIEGGKVKALCFHNGDPIACDVVLVGVGALLTFLVAALAVTAYLRHEVLGRPARRLADDRGAGLAQLVLGQQLDLVDLVAGAKAVEEMQERHPRLERGGQVAPEDRRTGPEQCKDQHPQQQRPLMVSPSAGNLVEHRL